MATSTVTTKATPQEHKVIIEALRMYNHYWKNRKLGHGNEHPLDLFVHNLDIIDADPRVAILISRKLVVDLGR